MKIIKNSPAKEEWRRHGCFMLGRESSEFHWKNEHYTTFKFYHFGFWTLKIEQAIIKPICCENCKYNSMREGKCGSCLNESNEYSNFKQK